VRRREFITLIGGTAAAWPMAVRAQQATGIPVIGYLYSGVYETSAPWLAAFREGLGELSFVEGRNVTIEYRWANNEPARLPELAADLVRRRVAVIVAPGTPASVRAAQGATSSIPIVFRTGGGDPVALGFVASLNQPGGNITGVNAMSLETGTKRLGLLQELVPGAMHVAVLVNPNDPNIESSSKELQAAASAAARQIELIGTENNHEIDAAFARLAKRRPDALLVTAQGLFMNRRVQIVTHATRLGLPGVYPVRDFVEVGGLMSYGSSATDQYRLTGVYTGRVLKGEKPATLPVLRASKFELVVNMQTAKILGLDVPPALLARADEVIE
jgi:putative ABC transport system substrate-binding protein